MNPFQVSGYQGAEYFCDRSNETKFLLSNISNGVSTTLVSLRRMGKTDLLYHVREQSKKNVLFLYSNILSTENKTQLLNSLGTSLAEAVSETSSLGRKIWNALISMRPVVSFDTLTGSPQLSFEISHDRAQNNIESLLRFLDSQSKRTVIALDEFQQITRYPEQNTDAWLRTIIQRLRNISFIFSGSRKDIMYHLFTDPSRPFYRSTSMLNLNRIPREGYLRFIKKHFKKGDKIISDEVITEMLDWADGYTYYVQLICASVYSESGKKVTTETWQEAASKLLKEHETIFFNYRELMTKHQWNLLKAIAAEGNVYSPTSHSFISKYSLGSSASVLRSLQSLMEKEMVYFDFDKSGKKFYGVYDLLLQRYVSRLGVGQQTG